MRHRLRLLLSALLSIAIASPIGCGGVSTTPIDETDGAQRAGIQPLPEAQPLRYYSGMTTRQRLIIRDGAAWAEAWKQMTSPLRPVPPVPEVDFAKSVIILAAMGAGRPTSARSTRSIRRPRRGRRSRRCRPIAATTPPPWSARGCTCSAAAGRGATSRSPRSTCSRSTAAGSSPSPAGAEAPGGARAVAGRQRRPCVERRLQRNDDVAISGRKIESRVVSCHARDWMQTKRFKSWGQRLFARRTFI
jgi:hypothetical protein